MTVSMTGYGRGTARDTRTSVAVEIKTLNHRHCDIQVKLPPGLWSLELPIKDLLSASIHRGRVEVLVHVLTPVAGAAEPIVDLRLARRFVRTLRQAGRQLGVPGEVDLAQLIRLPGVVRVEERPVATESLEPLVLTALRRAMFQVLRLRRAEGRRLGTEVRSRTAGLRRMVRSLRTRHRRSVARQESRLRRQLDQWLPHQAADGPRLSREAVLQHVRADITEELVRLDVHLTHLAQTLASSQPVGRRLDFLVQELNREINTVGSKSSDAGVAQTVVVCKEELEKIREQIQNLE